MKRYVLSRIARFGIMAAIVVGLNVSASIAEERVTAKTLLTKHLNSLGDGEARGKVISRVAQGKVVFAETIQHSLRIEGSATLLSQGNKHKSDFKYGIPQYPGEQFVFDGKAPIIAMVDNSTRSRLGDFLFMQEEILRDGLWGGVLSTAWPLLKGSEVESTLKVEGLKKVDGVELLVVSYNPKKRASRGDLKIRLYFDPTSYRHVRTVYTLTTLQDSEDHSDPGQVTTTVEERFSDFRDVDNLSLPLHWDIRYRVEPRKLAKEYQWDVVFSAVIHNSL
jgi:hypothetical protein